MPLPDHFTLIAAIIVGILSVARTIRLIAWDEFPPAAWFRENTLAKLGDKWGVLVTCGFCLSPYLSVGMFAWAYYSELHWTWWVINGIWGGCYLPAIIVSYDQPD